MALGSQGEQHRSCGLATARPAEHMHDVLTGRPSVQGIKLGRGQRVVGMSVLPAGTGQAEDVSSDGDEGDHAKGAEDAGGAALQAGPWLALVTERVSITTWILSKCDLQLVTACV